MIDDRQTLRSAGLPTLHDLKREDVIDEISKIEKIPKLFVGLYLYRVCPIPFLTDEARHYLEMYYALNGFSRIQTPSDMYQLSAKYIRIVRIINHELRKIQKERVTDG